MKGEKKRRGKKVMGVLGEVKKGRGRKSRKADEWKET